VSVIEDVLSTWREAERLLATLPPLSPDEEAIRLAILTLRECYQVMTRDQPPRPIAVARSRDTVERAQVLLAEIRVRTGASQAMGPAFGEAPG
jgi:hypothetical protein